MIRQHPDFWIQTFTGKAFWPLEPAPEDVCIEDIAHALSLLCRFGGHCSKFYSVAEHSVLAAAKAGIHGLLHDAAEAYLLDLPRPIKRVLPEYRTLEDKLLTVIYQSLKVPFPTADEIMQVTKADNSLLSTEKHVLMKDTTSWCLSEPSYPDVVINGFKPQDAESLFLSVFQRLYDTEVPPYNFNQDFFRSSMTVQGG